MKTSHHSSENLDQILRILVQGMSRDEQGIWRCAKEQLCSYPDRGNQECYQIEEGSYWFKVRNTLIGSVVDNFPPHGWLVDVGGGNGFVSKYLQDKGYPIVLLEPGVDGANNAKARGVQYVVNTSFEDLNCTAGSLGAVGLFDVLEHIADDSGFLRSMYSALASKGRLYITVPAFNALWSYEDEQAGHFRRYTLSTLSEVLHEAGFAVSWSSYCFLVLPLPIFLLRTLRYQMRLPIERHLSDYQRDHGNSSMFGRLMEWVLSFESLAINRQISLPFGSSCIAVATKEDGDST